MINSLPQIIQALQLIQCYYPLTLCSKSNQKYARELQNSIANLIDEKDKIIKDSQKQNEDINNYNKKIFELEKKIQSLEDQKAYNEDYRKKFEDQEKLIKNLQMQITSQNLKNYKKEIYLKDKKIKELSKEVQELKDQVKNMNQTYIDEIKAFNEKLNTEQNKVKTLENQIYSQRQENTQIQSVMRESQNQIKQTIEQKEQKIFDELRRQQDRMISLGEQHQIHQQQYYVDQKVQRLEMKFIRNGRSYQQFSPQTEPLFKPMIERITYEIQFTHDQNQEIKIPRLQIQSNKYFNDVLEQIFVENPNLQDYRIRKAKIQRSGVILPKNEWNKQIYLILGQSKEIQHEIQLISENS